MAMLSKGVLIAKPLKGPFGLVAYCAAINGNSLDCVGEKDAKRDIAASGFKLAFADFVHVASFSDSAPVEELFRRVRGIKPDDCDFIRSGGRAA